MAPAAKHWLIVSVVASIVMLTNLGGPRLWDRDEPRNAGCAREMLARHDWIMPTFNAELRPHKPVLLYWTIMASYIALGVGEFSARFPSALFAIGSTILTYVIGRRLFSPTAAFWSAIALATSMMFTVAGRAATPDSVFIFFTLLAMTFYVLGTFKPRGDGAEHDVSPQLKTAGHYFPQHWPWVAAMYTMMGFAVLAKGPVGLVLPTAVIGMFLLIMRLPAKATDTAVPAFGAEDTNPLSSTRATIRSSERSDLNKEAESESTATSASPGHKFADEPSEELVAIWLRRLGSVLRPFAPLHFLATCWYMRPITAILFAALVALPWYIAVGMKTDGEFISGFLWDHNLRRAMESFEGHRGGPLFYPALILAGFFPWSVFAIPLVADVVARLRGRDAWSPGYILAVCWIGVYVLLFTIARTKLPSYVTPCYPALALLAGTFVAHFSRQSATARARWLLPLSFGILALVGLVICLGMALFVDQFLPGEAWLAIIGAVPLVAGIACLALLFRQRPQAAAISFAVGAVLFPTLVMSLATQRVDAHQTNHLLLQAINEQSKSPEVASYKRLEPSWVFYGGWPIREFHATSGQPIAAVAPKGSSLDGKKVHVAQASPQAQAACFLAGNDERFLITTRSALEELQGCLPPGVEVLVESELFLKKKESLVLLGHPKLGTRLAEAPPASGETAVERK